MCTDVDVMMAQSSWRTAAVRYSTGSTALSVLSLRPVLAAVHCGLGPVGLGCGSVTLPTLMPPAIKENLKIAEADVGKTIYANVTCSWVPGPPAAEGQHAQAK